MPSSPSVSFGATRSIFSAMSSQLRALRLIQTESVRFKSDSNVKQLRSFIGLASYCRRFVKNFSKIAKPMTELLCKGKRYTWSSACQGAFEELKRRLPTAPILTPPDESHPFQIFCDA